MKVKSEIDIYEIICGKDASIDCPPLLVESHWNDYRLIVLVTPGGAKFTVSADQLKAAIQNAENHK